MVRATDQNRPTNEGTVCSNHSQGPILFFPRIIRILFFHNFSKLPVAIFGTFFFKITSIFVISIQYTITYSSRSMPDKIWRCLLLVTLKESFLRDRNSLSFKLTGKVAAKTMHLDYLRFTEQRLKRLPMTIQKTTKFPQMATTSITVKMAVQKKSAP